jgi:hypothetical protein
MITLLDKQQWAYRLPVKAQVPDIRVGCKMLALFAQPLVRIFESGFGKYFPDL